MSETKRAKGVRAGSSARRWALGLSLVAVVVVGFVGWQLLPTRTAYYTDADSIKRPIDGARVRDVLWKPAVRLPDEINTRTDDYEPQLSDDERSIIFVRGKAGENADIYTAQRTADGWSEPRPIESLNSEFEELGPHVSPDGETLYFYTDRPGGFGGYDIWTARRDGDQWRTPINLGPHVNSSFNDYGPALTPDGATLYFASNRPTDDVAERPSENAWPATVREDLFNRTYDLYASEITEAGQAPARPLAALNTPHNEGTPSISSVGDFLYFSSDRPGGEGAFDLYRSRRLRGELQPPENLGVGVNSAANELDPALSLNGFALHFSSDRRVESDAVDAPIHYDLYRSVSREVFREVETTHATFDWSGLWMRIGPNLLWLLLSLLLLLLLLALIRGAAQRRLSLLAKCLLGSILAHLVLMLLLNFWEVTAGIVDSLREGGGVRIAFASEARADDLVAQIRGDLTQVDTPQAVEFDSQRRSEMEDVTVPDALTSMSTEHVELRAESLPDENQATAEAPARRTDPPRPETALSRLDSPVKPETEIAIPHNPLRSATTEPASRPTPAPATLAPTDRSDIDPALQRHAPSRQVAVAPSQRLPSDTSAAARSLAADASSGDDAMPAFSPVSLSVDAPESPNAIPSAAIALPDVPTRDDSHVEPATPVAAIVTASPDRTRSSAVEAAALDPREFSEIRPATVSANADGGFVDASSARSAPSPGAAIPLAAATSAFVESTVAPPRPVALPSLEESRRIATATETSTRLAHRPAAPLRRAHESSSAGSAEPSAISSLSPASVAAVGQSMPMLAEFNGVTTEAPPATGRRNDVSAAAASAMPVPLSSLALALPEASEPGEQTTEATARAAHAAGGNVRPSLVAESSNDDLGAAREVVSLAPEFVAGRGISAPSLAAMTLRDSLHSTPTLALSIDRTGGFKPRSPPQLRLPDEQTAAENAFAQRAEKGRMAMIKRLGGSDATELAVARALHWLAEHQSADGRWDGDGFDLGCGGCGGETDVATDVGLTGLALLCFLGADHTHTRDGDYRDTVRRGIDWLLSVQKPDGDLRIDETMYSHGMATIALSEAFGITGDARLAGPVRRAVRFIEGARNRSAGGWRYDPGQEGDTSVLGWQVMALKSARMAGIAVSDESFEAAARWLQEVSRSSNPGLYAYRPRRRPSPSMTAEGMFIQQLLGRHRAEHRMQASADYVLDHLPDWHDEVNTYFWYYATLAMFQHQGDEWRTWNEAITRELLEHQERDGRREGSWKPVGEWAPVGGRVYQTALCTLMLEVYYRYLPLYAEPPPIETAGAIYGVVSDADSGMPLPGALVRLDLPDRAPLVTTTGPEGRYVLHPPELPDFFAVSASADGFTPVSENVESADLREQALELDFPLASSTRDVVAVEAVPEVHHLGNDEFTGSINSQFQKHSEGRSFEAEFTLTADQLPPQYTRAEVWMLAKGVQCPSHIRINDELLDERMDRSPRDGSFGETAAEFDASLLHEGVNTVEIKTISCSGDLDDMEFVNLQIRLYP